jgi:hypothetical protein
VCYVTTFVFYVVLCLAHKNGSAPLASASRFIGRLLSLFLVPYCKATVFGGWRQVLPPDLSEPWSPVGHTLAVVHLISSLTIPTCVPGAVRQLTTAAPWSTALWCSTRQCWATVCIDKHPQQQAGRSIPSAIWEAAGNDCRRPGQRLKS